MSKYINPCYLNLFVNFDIKWEKSDRIDVYNYIISKKDVTDDTVYCINQIRYSVSSSQNYFDFKPDVLQKLTNDDGSHIKFTDMVAYMKATINKMLYGVQDNDTLLNNQMKGCSAIKCECFSATDYNHRFTFTIYRKGITVIKPFGSFRKKLIDTDYVTLFCDGFLTDYFKPGESFDKIVKKWKKTLQ